MKKFTVFFLCKTGYNRILKKIIAVQNHLEISFGTALVCKKILKLEINTDISNL